MDFPGSLPAAVAPLPGDVDPTDLLRGVLDVSLTALQLLRPVYAPDGAAIIDFTPEYTNPAGLRMLGYGQQPRGTMLELFPHTLANGIFAYYQRAFAAPEPLTYELNYQTDGLDNYFRVQARRQGPLLLVSFTDTSDQPRSAAEQFLRDSQAAEQAARTEAERQRQRFHEVLMQLPAYVAVYHGPDHTYQFVNPPYQGMFPDRSFPGRTLGEAIPEVHGLGVGALFDRVYQTGEPFHIPELEGWFDFKGSGEPEQVFLNLHLQPLRDAQGRVDGVLDYSYNITEQVRARRQVEQLNQELEARVQARTADLQESEMQFRTMADAAPAMLWVTDPAGQCTYLNAQWYQYTGQTEAEALGLGWTRAVHPDDAALARQQFLDANARRVPFHLRYRLRRHDGVYRWAIDAGQPRFAEDGPYAGFVGTVVDIHEQQLAEDELHATNTRLTRTNVDLDNFIYTASHDLKAPITNIEGLLLALEEELLPAARTGDVPLMLTMMQDAVDRFRRTIDHLTDLSRLQKEHSPDRDTVALAPVVEAVRLDLTPLLAQTQGRLTVDVPADLTVTFAEKNLRSVVYNLLSNAFKYRHPDRAPAVQLRARATDDHVVLEVQDNGLGLDLGQGEEKLFAMFQRLHTHVEGTGVGLYMVKRILENASGRIEVSSAVGQGSTFRVYFRR
ncbi:PAS domain-containing sensor histidine kinase [Hymenobacter sp. ASUV-10]|uniref:histidine kinase n=1 Tax=Hymenobacter aranciens TaxID=3063996 RepID=A0ABT9BIV7_9BACT|nr:PAS domain-containing sensor histidine kinase [Hymenobacter sp. ASUV-10]MDO7877629.1 PAS domain-containing sensor histidine kinase [Hymenobacter sp. ASUV-10]